MLVLPKGKHQRVQDDAQVGNQLRARLLLQGGKRTEWGEQSKAKMPELNPLARPARRHQRV